MKFDSSISSFLCHYAAVLLLTLMIASPAAAQGSSELTVGVVIVPPFVIRQNGSLTGFGIDLWNAVAARLKFSTNYQIMPDVTSVFAAVRSKKADVIGSPVVITEARDEEFDFSLPIMQAGVQILVRDTGENTTRNPLKVLLRNNISN